LGSELVDTVLDESEVADEIRKLKERLCTVEGRQKVVQGKVSQLDKLYGSNSAAWGRHIKGLIQLQQGKQNEHLSSSEKDMNEQEQKQTCDEDVEHRNEHRVEQYNKEEEQVKIETSSILSASPVAGISSRQQDGDMESHIDYCSSRSRNVDDGGRRSNSDANLNTTAK
jgi:hypothetical protein